MKKYFILSIFLLFAFNAIAQFRLHGSVAGAVAHDTLAINIPFVFGHDSANSIRIALDRQGRFDQVIGVTEQKFATLAYRGITTTLLLSPGKAVSFRINARDTTIEDIKGSAATENKLLYDLDMDRMPVRLLFEEILFLESAGNYMRFVLSGDRAILSRLTMNEALSLLPPEQFTRVHRSFVVNRSKIQRTERHQLHIGEQLIPLSGGFSDDLRLI